MDYKKTLRFYKEDGETIMFKFDIVLNRAIAFNGLKEFPKIADVIINGVDVKGGKDKSEKELVYDSIVSGNIEKIFTMNDEMPKLITYLFPKMLDSGTIEVGDKNSIIELVNDLVYDDDFLKAMTDFFMQALAQKEKVATKKVKFSMK